MPDSKEHRVSMIQHYRYWMGMHALDLIKNESDKKQYEQAIHNFIAYDLPTLSQGALQHIIDDILSKKL